MSLACLASSAWCEEETALLHVSVQQGTGGRAAFKLFDAGEGCPSYNDLPGARAYLGSLGATVKGKSMRLPKGRPVHVFLFRPRDSRSLMGAGLAQEIRRRALQVTLHGDSARLVMTGFENRVPAWSSSGDITLEPATACEDVAAE
jgi:hypothetical protein